jgi:hypothetical protein
MLVLSMIFLHIFADFTLQGLLGQLKQKNWWINNYPQNLYKYDWIICGILHAFEWTFVIYIPIFIKYKFILTLPICISFTINIIIHFIVDHLKANKQKINLTIDQFCHLLQIWITAGIFIYVY